ncbi:MAG: hypothetical protein Rubg2KO_34020 [Rubricoccaceae bacterium]
MSVKLRFRRMGRRKQPVYSLVATDSRSPRDGRFIEDLGRYEPVLEPATVTFNEDRIIYWLGQGAQPSNTVRNLLQKEGILLRSAMTRRGAEPEAIEQAVAEFKERQSSKVTTKKTVAERRAEALENERKAAAEKAAELEKARKEREAELAKEREAAEAAARAEAEESRAQAAADAADSEALTTASDETIAAEAAPEAEAAPADDASSEAEGASSEADAVPTAETEEASDEAVAETTEDAVAESAPAVAEEQPAVEAETTEEVAAEAAEEVAEQAEAASEEADTVEAAPEAAAAPAETPVDTTADATTDATEPEIADEGETVAATDQPASDADIATGTSEVPGDDLTTLKGVGPKYATILNDAGIATYALLAEQTVDRLQEIITEAGSTTAGNEETWPEQARLLATGDQTGFEAYVESL